jgi:hypothetical protein
MVLSSGRSGKIFGCRGRSQGVGVLRTGCRARLESVGVVRGCLGTEVLSYIKCRATFGEIGWGHRRPRQRRWDLRTQLRPLSAAQGSAVVAGRCRGR